MAQSRDPHDNSESPERVVVAIMGATGAGKSSFLSMFGAPAFKVGHRLKSETKEPTEWTGTYKGVLLTLLDTPGFGDTNMSDTAVLEKIALWLQKEFEQGKKINGIIYLHRITDNRMTHIDTTNIKMFQNLCGKGALKNAILCTSFWDAIDKAIGERREQELRDDFWKYIIRMGASVARHDNTRDSATAIIDRILNQNGVNLKIQEEMRDGKKLDETEAGRILNADLLEKVKSLEDKLAEMQKTYREALAEHDEAMIEILREEREKARQTAERYEEDKRRLEQDIQGLKDKKYQRPASGFFGSIFRWLDNIFN